MEVISSSSYPSGRLNPNAPMFVPGAYRAVEDFSEEWWALVHSCPWFRDYWLQERYLDTDDLLLLPDSLDAGADDDDDDVWCYSDYYCPHADVEIEENKSKELAKIGTMKWQNGRALAQVPRYAEKAPKILKGKMSPRTIQQPK